MNKFTPINEALCERTFTKGLSSYTQSNCQVTLTDKGYRIYRPPNVNPSANGSTMWGGLVLLPFVNDENFFVQYHSYIMMFHISGKSSNRPDFGWSNNVGWGGGGLNPLPTEIGNNLQQAEFQGETDFYYAFTINDSIYKVCTSSYSIFVQGNTYLSYKGFKFGFSYTDTGTLGTDLYLTNFRCYDITNPTNCIEVKKNGIITSLEFSESPTPPSGKTQFYSSGEILSREIIEY